MASTAIGLSVGITSDAVGSLISLPAWALSNVMLRIIEVFGSIPFALADVTHARLLAITVAVVLFILWFQKHHFER
jgi:hypothetical protein